VGDLDVGDYGVKGVLRTMLGLDKAAAEKAAAEKAAAAEKSAAEKAAADCSDENTQPYSI